MKKSAKHLIALVLAICCVLNGIPSISANAATKKVTGVETGFAYKSGRYIYYAFEMEGTRTNIMRLDTKTKKKKSIISYMYKGNPTNGFDNLTIKGNYIYACWDLFYGTDSSDPYIYRFSKDGKSKKRLAAGSNPVIIKNRIYYQKWNTKNYTSALYSMKLNGTDKKKVGALKNLKLKPRVFNYDYAQNHSSLTVGNYKYYIGNNQKTIYRYNKKTKKTNKVITYPTSVDTFMVQGDYVISKGYKGSWDNYSTCRRVTYCVKSNGKNKIHLKSWAPGE